MGTRVRRRICKTYQPLGRVVVQKLTSSVFYKVLQQSTSIPIQKDTGDFCLLDRRCIDALKQFRESERYTKGFFSWIGYRKKEIEYVCDPRAAGETKWNYFKLMNLAIDGIASFTTAPLRISTFIGLAVPLLALYILFIWSSGRLYLGLICRVSVHYGRYSLPGRRAVVVAGYYRRIHWAYF